MYTSNGRCGYHLVSDCETNQFDVKITFDETTESTIMTIIFGSEILILSDRAATYNQKKYKKFFCYRPISVNYLLYIELRMFFDENKAKQEYLYIFSL